MLRIFFGHFSVSVDIPDNTPLGTYYLYYHNGMGGKTAWSEPLRIDVVSKSPDWWGVKVFNVMDYGAVGDGVHNETATFRANCPSNAAVYNRNMVAVSRRDADMIS